MEYLDIYDENRKFLGKEERGIVHQKGLWHNTVHCWLYDNEGNIYFQIRADENKMYTTASGHVNAGETLEEAFGREIYEEIGIKIDYKEAKNIGMVIWKMDKKKADGSMFIDRAFSNTYVYDITSNTLGFKFDPSEVSGLIKINANEALKILEQEKGEAKANVITNENNEVVIEDRNVKFTDFLINAHETGTQKYGHVLNSIIKLTK